MSIQQRAYPKEGAQLRMLFTHCGQTRWLYNHGLAKIKALSKEDRAGGARVNATTLCKDLTQLRKEHDWLRGGATAVQQQAFRDLDRAMRNFFEKRAGFPVFKRKFARDGFYIRDVKVRKYSKRYGAVLVPKAGWLKFRLTRPFSEVQRATSARVTIRNNEWYVSFTTPPPEKKSPANDNVVGIDRGVVVTAMTSDGDEYLIPGLSPKQRERFEHLQRTLATQEKGSNRRRRTLRELARLRAKETHRRKDWVEKITTEISRKHGLAVIEDLKASNMVRRPEPKTDGDGGYLPNGASAKRGLNRGIHSSRWSEFATRLEHKMDVVKVPAFNSSRECHRCGFTDRANRPSQAVFSCLACGETLNADLNAALVIRGRGVAQLGPGTQGDWTKQTDTVSDKETEQEQRQPTDCLV